MFALNCSKFAKKAAVGWHGKHIFLACLPRLRQVGLDANKNGRRAMKLASANKVDSTKNSAMREQAQVRIVILALVSFLLGVAATTFWFRFSSNSNPENSIVQTTNEVVRDEPAAQTINPNSPARKFAEPAVPVGPAAIEDVKRALPNYASLTVDQGTEILREAALKKYAAAAQELQSQITQAQAELNQAEGKSLAEHQAAMKHLQQVQAEQSQKLQQIGGQLQTQVAALKQLKGTTP